MNYHKMPDEYRNPGVPFRRSTRPLGVSYFPEGFFGDDDVFIAMQKMNTVTYLSEPEWDDDANSWKFMADLDGVRAVVPVQQIANSRLLEPRTIWPDGGSGVRVYRGGRYYDVP